MEINNSIINELKAKIEAQAAQIKNNNKEIDGMLQEIEQLFQDLEAPTENKSEH